MDGPFYCPKCGYDQRGQPVDGLCPECGAKGASVEAARINQWADHALVDLWGIGVLQCAGTIFGAMGYGVMAAGVWVGGLLVAAALMLVVVASGWFVLTLVRYLRRRCRPNFANLMEWRQRQLRRWLVIDLMLVAVPPVVWVVWPFL